MISSAYVHIPFCTHICSYCDFCKMFYNEKLVDSYLDALEKEIQTEYHGEALKTIYIGGGTPSCLSLIQLKKLFSILSQFKKAETCEYTIELNVENTTAEKLKLCKEFGINRLSFGVESTNRKHLRKLNRHHTKEQVQNIIKQACQIGFHNINVDLIYALPNETLEDVKEDLEFVKMLPITHVSTYSLMIEEHTKFYIDSVSSIKEEIDQQMYEYICQTLSDIGFVHYEISNFAKTGYQSKHNLTYWNNEKYYGFGLGASGYIEHIRYTNTKSLRHYLEGKYRLVEEEVTRQDEMCYEMILGLRKLEGVSNQKFQEKFQKSIEDVFSYQEELEHELLKKENGYLKLNPSKLYLSNEALIAFVGGENHE